MGVEREEASSGPMEQCFIEVRTGSTSRRVPLPEGEATVGRGDDCTVSLAQDTGVSRLHVRLRRYGRSWCIRDLGSANGTFLNGRRLQDERTLHHGDEILVGKPTLILRDAEGPVGDAPTELVRVPDLTAREREVLKALCRPALDGEVFTEPATVRDVSAALFVSEAAVKQHLLRLFDKFRISDGPGRRTRLANEAFRRGAVSRVDL